MTLDAAEIKQAVLDRDETRVRELLRHATEPDRRACATELKEFLADPDEPGTLWRDKIAWRPAFGVAAVGLAGGVAAAHRGWEHAGQVIAFGREPAPSSVLDAIVGVLADRNPRWLGKFADRLLRAQERMVRSTQWQIIRDLVRLGLIDKPERPAYTTAMIAGLDLWHTDRTTLPLRSDPELLEDEIWRLFTVPEAGEYLEGAWDWSRELTALAEDGTISRDRLIDSCLDAFVRDFPPHHVGWYLNLHDRLAPSPEEKAARSGKYLALLSATSKTGVQLGQRECGALMEADLLDPQSFLAASAPALLFSVKLVVTAHLKLIDALIKARPALRDEALATAAIAFQHEREDLQAAALKLIKKHGVPADGEPRAAIEALTAVLSPVIVPDAVTLGLMPEPEPVAAPPGELPPSESPVSTRVQPVETGEELIQSLALLLEDASDLLEVERVMAGAVRLASLPLDTRTALAAPLLKRAEEQTWPEATWTGHPPECHLSYLAIAWATGRLEVQRYPAWMDDPDHRGFPGVRRNPADWVPEDPVHGVTSTRLWEACLLITAGPGGPLLAEPEFTDGTISEDTLLHRLLAWRPASGGPPRSDIETALLRLTPPADDAFWADWDSAPVVTVGEAPSAAKARAMYDDGHAVLEFEPVFVPDPRWPQALVLGKLTGIGAVESESRCWTTVVADPAYEDWPYNQGYAPAFYAGEAPLLLPYQPELAGAHLMRLLSGASASGPVGQRATGVLSDVGATLDQREFGRICHLALVTGLASPSPDARLAAASAWARVALDGRLNPDLAAEAITGGVAAGAFMPKRIAESLGQAALDPAVTPGVGAACLTASAALLRDRPRGLHLLLELAARCYAASGTTPSVVPDPVKELARSSARTKLADAARRLPHPPAPNRANAAAHPC